MKETLTNKLINKIKEEKKPPSLIKVNGLTYCHLIEECLFRLSPNFFDKEADYFCGIRIESSEEVEPGEIDFK